MYLSNETIDVSMSEKFGQNNLLKFANVFNDKLFPIKCPKYYFIVVLVLN